MPPYQNQCPNPLKRLGGKGALGQVTIGARDYTLSYDFGALEELWKGRSRYSPNGTNSAGTESLRESRGVY